MPCQTLVYLEDIPSLVNNTDSDNLFIYGQDGPFQAVYDVLNVYDLEGNQIGTTRLDAKIVTIPGSITLTYTSVTNIDNGPENAADYVYLAGTRQYILDSTGLKPGYSNTVVQNVVSCNKTYTQATIDSVLLPEKNKILVTIRY
jgi:hypothetical protein